MNNYIEKTDVQLDAIIFIPRIKTKNDSFLETKEQNVIKKGFEWPKAVSFNTRPIFKKKSLTKISVYFKNNYADRMSFEKCQKIDMWEDGTYANDSYQNDLSFGLFYYFSNEILIRIEDILYHPYCRFIDDKLLPYSFMDAIDEKYAPFIKDTRYHYRTFTYYDIQFDEKAYNSYYKIITNLKNINFQLNFYVGKFINHGNRKILKLAKTDNCIQFVKTKKEFIKLFSPQMIFKYLDEDDGYKRGKAIFTHDLTNIGADSDIFSNFLIDYTNSKLVFHPLEAELGLAYTSFKLAHYYDIPKKFNFTKIIEGMEDIQLYKKLLQEKLDDNLTFFAPSLINAGKIKDEKIVPLEINLILNQEQMIGVTLLTNDHSISNFPVWVNLLITTGFQEGFKALFGDNGSYLVAKSGNRRSFDLKILRHRGIFLCFVYEVINYILFEATPEGKTFKTKKKFLDYLFLKLGSILDHKKITADAKSKSLRSLCSRKMVKGIEKVYDFYIEICSSGFYLYMNNIESCIQRSPQAYLSVIHLLVKYIIYKSNGNRLLKQTSKYDWFWRETSKELWYTETENEKYDKLEYWNLISDSKNDSSLLRELLSLKEEYPVPLNLLWDGQKIEYLDENNFTAKFTLDDSNTIKEDDEKIEWFALHPEFFLGGVEISQGQAKKLMDSGVINFEGKLYYLKSSALPKFKTLSRFWAKISGDGIAKRNSIGVKIVKIPKNQTLNLLSLRAQGFDVLGGKEWGKICSFYDTLSKKRDLRIPTSVKVELKPFQRDGVRWLLDIYNLKLGGILADDMGLGKTLQALTFFEILRHNKKLRHVLVVVPSSLTYNWRSESEKFTPNLPLKIFESKEKKLVQDYINSNKHCVIIATYKLVVENQMFFLKNNWNIHTYDEAQYLKNITAQRTSFMRSLPATVKVCLTGTPMENHFGEFYSLVDLCVPGALGKYSNFKAIYCGSNTIKKSDIDDLKLIVKPLILRREKKEILKELPEKTETVVKIPFDDKQREIYRNIALSWNEKVQQSINQDGVGKSQLVMLTALLRLRQTCSDPSAISGITYQSVPPKIKLLLSSILELVENGESAIIFTQFKNTLEKIYNILTINKIQTFIIQGETSRKKREERLKSFNKLSSGAVMLMTLKTGGVGLNLTKATHVFHMEPWWNPAVENQGTDRAYRMGQNKEVNVYRYLMEQSVEEKIEILKKRKSSYFDSLFSNSEDFANMNFSRSKSSISKDDFQYLIS